LVDSSDASSRSDVEGRAGEDVEDLSSHDV
jgi:hypothetical protein